MTSTPNISVNTSPGKYTTHLLMDGWQLSYPDGLYAQDLVIVVSTGMVANVTAPFGLLGLLTSAGSTF